MDKLTEQLNEVARNYIESNVREMLKLHNEIQRLKSICEGECAKIIESEREFVDGEKVAIYSGHGVFVAHGFVCSARLPLRLNYSDITDYLEENQHPRLTLARATTTILYEVFAAKKDGSKSIKHYDGFEHFMVGAKHKEEFRFYIDKIK
jgi:hypothetical protein